MGMRGATGVWTPERRATYGLGGAPPDADRAKPIGEQERRSTAHGKNGEGLASGMGRGAWRNLNHQQTRGKESVTFC